MPTLNQQDDHPQTQLPIQEGLKNAPAANTRRALVKQRTKARARKEKEQYRPLCDPAPEPWKDEVNGEQLFDEITARIKRYISLPNMAAELLALWAVATHAASNAQHFPRLFFASIDASCGKSLALEVLRFLCCRSFLTQDISAAAIYRLVDEVHPTLLLDETDTWLGRGYRALLNSGHAPNGVHCRCQGKDHEPRAFSTYAPTALARIGSFDSSYVPLLSRSIKILMSRNHPVEKLARLDDEGRCELKVLAAKAQRWLRDCDDRDPDPVMPDFLKHRDADNWRFIFSLANVAGSKWQKIILDVVEALGKPKPTYGAVDTRGLLSAIKSVIDNYPHSAIHTVELCKRLSRLDTYEHATLFQDLNEKRAGRILRKKLGDVADIIRPKKVRIGDRVLQGYLLADFKDLFERYSIKSWEEADAALEVVDGGMT